MKLILPTAQDCGLAAKAGVEVLAYTCHVSPQEITLRIASKLFYEQTGQEADNLLTNMGGPSPCMGQRALPRCARRGSWPHNAWI